MKILKKLFSSKEVKDVFSLLDEAKDVLNCESNDYEAFQLVRSQIENTVLEHSYKFSEVLRKGMSLREWVYSAIANTAVDNILSGKHHVSRGKLNPNGAGEDLLDIFYASLDELTRMGVIDIEKAKKEKAAILKDISNAG